MTSHCRGGKERSWALKDKHTILAWSDPSSEGVRASDRHDDGVVWKDAGRRPAAAVTKKKQKKQTRQGEGRAFCSRARLHSEILLLFPDYVLRPLSLDIRTNLRYFTNDVGLGGNSVWMIANKAFNNLDENAIYSGVTPTMDSFGASVHHRLSVCTCLLKTRVSVLKTRAILR